MTRPVITEANCTDFRTPDGNRVTGGKSVSISAGNIYLTFERPFSLDTYSPRNLSQSWHVVKATGSIPSSYPEITLVYDPIRKPAPWATPVASDNFWLVWNPKGRSPSYRHPTETSAVREAERLSGVVPGDDFFVLKATSKTHTPRPEKTATNTAFFL